MPTHGQTSPDQQSPVMAPLVPSQPLPKPRLRDSEGNMKERDRRHQGPSKRHGVVITIGGGRRLSGGKSGTTLSKHAFNRRQAHLSKIYWQRARLHQDMHLLTSLSRNYGCWFTSRNSEATSSEMTTILCEYATSPELWYRRFRIYQICLFRHIGGTIFQDLG